VTDRRKGVENTASFNFLPSSPRFQSNTSTRRSTTAATEQNQLSLHATLPVWSDRVLPGSTSSLSSFLQTPPPGNTQRTNALQTWSLHFDPHPIYIARQRDGKSSPPSSSQLLESFNLLVPPQLTLFLSFPLTVELFLEYSTRGR